MSFVARFEEIMQKREVTLLWKLSLHTAWISVLVFIFAYWYLSLTEPESSIVTTNKALADTAMILIGLSFALSGLCYFWNFVDTKIIYRKYLGLSGFAFGLAHGVMSAIFYFVWKPRGYENNPIFIVGHQWDFGAFLVPNQYAFFSAVIAISIFTMMAVISNQYAVHELGGIWWRRLLRVGYLAYIFATIHFAIKNIPEWRLMMKTPEFELPPLNFWVFLLVCGVIGLRLALWHSLRKKAKLAPVPPVTPAPSVTTSPGVNQSPTSQE
jgi:DMSO/TMAO reductase YedYZ heme-binding membrane subunit